MRKAIFCAIPYFFLIFLLLSSPIIEADDKVQSQLQNFLLQTKTKIKEFNSENRGTAWIVNKDNFPALDGVTCFTLELWDESMRIPHWHPNAPELGYVISGTVEIIIWRSLGEASMFTATEGSCWFIPQGALHALINIGKDKAQLLVGFGSDSPQDIDLPVAFNGVPVPVRDAYTSPHSDLKKWDGTILNPLVGKYTSNADLTNQTTGSPYGFNLAQVPPLFNDAQMGSVVWGVKDNWSILKGISVLRAHLKPGTARDAIWYPDAGTLYVVSQGNGQFHIITPGEEPRPLDVQLFDYIYVPVGTLHTFLNTSSKEDFEVIAFFTQENPLPEVSLSVSTAFFPNSIRKDAMTEYGNIHKKGNPLKDLKFTNVSPYLLRVDLPQVKTNHDTESLLKR